MLNLKKLCLILCLFCAGCFGPSQEELDRDKPQVLKYIESFFDKGQHDRARELINKYGMLDDPDLLKWRERNDKAQLIKLKGELNQLKEHDYERRHEILGRLMSLDEKGGQHYVAQLKNQEKWDAYKEKHGDYENDCNSNGAKSLAYVMLRERVKQRLSAPASAKFPWANEIEINVTKPCDFAINGYVDSQNKYGAMIRTFYKGTLRRDLENKDRFIFIKVEM